jgi:hypothetical protein
MTYMRFGKDLEGSACILAAYLLERKIFRTKLVHKTEYMLCLIYGVKASYGIRKLITKLQEPGPHLSQIHLIRIFTFYLRSILMQ